MTATARANRRQAATVKPLRKRRRLSDRITFGHAAPVILAVGAGVFNMIALADRSATTQVPVANGPIVAGATVDSGDTHLVTVHSGDSALRAGLLSPSSLRDGWVAAVAINAGDPITRSVVAHAASGQGGLGAMSIPVAVSHADGGAIVAGDHVDVMVQNGAGAAQYVAQDLRVLGVPSTRNGSVLATSNNDYYVVVAVDRATALRLGNALAASSGGPGSSSGVQVVRTTGEPTP